MSVDTETTTYRGDTLEELLPRIREELGADAVIVRQREGIVGGVGGFFGKKCVEVDARPAQSRPAVPPRSVVDAYDTGEATDPDAADAESFHEFEPFEQPLEDYEPLRPEAAFEAIPEPLPAF